MKKKQPEGTKKADEIVSEKAIDNFNAILENALKAWNLIPLLYPDGIGKLHDEVIEKCENIDKKHNKDSLSKLLPYLVKIPYHVEEGLRSNLINELESSFENYREANHFCNVKLKEFQKIKNTINKKFISIFPIFEFLKCCRSITNILKEDSYNVLEYEKGKYINQVERFRNLAGHFRKFSTDIVRLDSKNEKLNEYLYNIHTLAKRVADMCDKKAGKIEADNKLVTFMKPKGDKVFIVHGHNKAILQELKKFLKNQYGIKPVVLSKEPNEGKAIIEKFERDAGSSCFAFVIMTNDDCVKKEEKSYYQGRPNVFLELGWFCGRYGRDRVMIIKEDDVKEGSVKMPSDFDGVITINFNKNLEKSFAEIKKELKHSGIIKQTANYNSKNAEKRSSRK